MSTWALIRTPGGVHVWDLGDGDDAQRTDLINRARVTAGFPADDAWVGSGYDLSLSSGAPHPSLLDRATVGTVEDLSKVDARLVDQHVAARLQAHHATAVAGAKRAILALDEARLEQVLDDPEVAARIAEASDVAGTVTTRRA